MGAERLVLYGNDMWSSPYVLSCFVALTEKGLPFELRTVALHERAQRIPLREERSVERVFFPAEGLPPCRPLSARAKRAIEKLVGFAERVVPPGGGALFGAWSIADTDLAMMLQRLVKTNEPLPPRLRAFAEREWQRPSVRAYVTAPRPSHHKPALT
jgi:glutathione S-transferase